MLAEWDEPLHVMPTCQGMSEGDLAHRGSYVLMKVGKNTPEVKGLLRRGGFGACAVQRCGMQGEQVYYGVDAIPDDAGYLTTIIAKGSADETDAP